MEKMVEALTPAFVASFALQQLLELLDPLLDRFARPHKKWILSAISLVMALAVTLGLGLRLLAPFGLGNGGVWDAIVTALFLTGGTKGTNDLLKWVGYKKESAKRALPPEAAAQV